jgi:hypothetical protein
VSVWTALAGVCADAVTRLADGERAGRGDQTAGPATGVCMAVAAGRGLEDGSVIQGSADAMDATPWVSRPTDCSPGHSVARAGGRKHGGAGEHGHCAR